MTVTWATDYPRFSSQYPISSLGRGRRRRHSIPPQFLDLYGFVPSPAYRDYTLNNVFLYLRLHELDISRENFSGLCQGPIKYRTPTVTWLRS